ncbi:MAG: metallophosphoesterase family protein [Spirochaetales bacterium]|nr:metallophosphoesterase family protein [Spirochaetales bacterium]
MRDNRKLIEKKLSQLWENTEIDVLETAGEKYVIMSDLHIGDGGGADNLCDNKEAILRALEYYKNNGFKLILLGDIEEFWQFTIKQIKKCYGKSIYPLLMNFGEDRVYRVYGNHDLDWSIKDSLKTDEVRISEPVEALKMIVKEGESGILLVHGHQGTFVGDTNSWLSRFFIKYIWTPLEPVLRILKIESHPSAARSQVTERYEQILYSWAKTKTLMLICGHSHRAIFAAKSYYHKLKEEIRVLNTGLQTPGLSKERIQEIKKRRKHLNKIMKEEKKKGRRINPAEKDKTPVPCYFNCGCALYTNGITVLEIENSMIRLVKWHRTPLDGRFFEVYDDGKGQTLSDYIQKIKT